MVDGELGVLATSYGIRAPSGTRRAIRELAIAYSKGCPGACIAGCTARERGFPVSATLRRTTASRTKMTALSTTALRALLAATSLALPIAAAQAQDAAAGGMAFQQCADCHSPGGADGVGPGLKGIFGRRAGTKSGFAYSESMAKSAIVWDATALNNFLAAPQKAMPGTTMAYPGDDDAKERADLVAYLLTLK
jgi:cytochrome c